MENDTALDCDEGRRRKMLAAADERLKEARLFHFHPPLLLMRVFKCLQQELELLCKLSFSAILAKEGRRKYSPPLLPRNGKILLLFPLFSTSKFDRPHSFYLLAKKLIVINSIKTTFKQKSKARSLFVNASPFL